MLKFLRSANDAQFFDFADSLNSDDYERLTSPHFDDTGSLGDYRLTEEEQALLADRINGRHSVKDDDPLANVTDAALDGLWTGAKDVATSEIPIIAQARALNEIWTGRDLISGEQLSDWDRSLRFLDLIPVFGNDARRSLGLADDARDAMRRLDDVGDAAGDAGKALKSSPHSKGVVSPKAVEGVKRVTGEALADARKEFNRRKPKFWKNEAANNPSKYSPEDLERLKKGKAPIGLDGHPLELHHKVPLAEGGSNDFENLIPMTRTDHRLGPNYKKTILDYPRYIL